MSTLLHINSPGWSYTYWTGVLLMLTNPNLPSTTSMDLPLANHLLAMQPKEVRDRLFSNLEQVFLPLGQVLYESGDVMRHVYFPADSIVALLSVLKDGATAEISLVGNEGVVGVALFMGGDSTSHRAVVESEGIAYRLSAARLKDEFDRHAVLETVLLRYTQALITQMSQTVVCNRHHTIDQQLCRWLLLSLDRLPGSEVNITQALIAKMLGVRREGVTEAASKLQRQGAIAYQRGRICVLDRPKIESLSCECYHVVKRETDRLLHPVRPYR